MHTTSFMPEDPEKHSELQDHHFVKHDDVLQDQNSTEGEHNNQVDKTDGNTETDSEPPRPTKSHHPIFIVVMGVASTGKSTLGKAIAERLNIPYIEGDNLHPKSNIEKMSNGIPLTDADREPWLELLRTTAEHAAAGQQTDPSFNRREGALITCSALRKYYREILRGTHKAHSVPDHLESSHPHVIPTYFVFIKGSKELLMERIQQRDGHFMKSNMLDSQFKTLESPEGEEGVVVVSAEDSTEEQVEAALEGLAKLVGPL